MVAVKSTYALGETIIGIFTVSIKHVPPPVILTVCFATKLPAVV